MAYGAQLALSHHSGIAADQPIIDGRRLIPGLAGLLSLVRRKATYPATGEDFANLFLSATGRDVKNNAHSRSIRSGIGPSPEPAQ
jgi:hypothetical protein